MKWQNIVPVVLIAVVEMLLVAACGSSNVVQNIKKESLYERVIRTGKIRAAYAVYSPLCMKDPATGKLSGIGVEAIELVARKLGLTVEYVEEVSFANLMEGLKTDRYDLFVTPIWTTANRARVIDFSDPLFFNPIFVYVKAGDHRFTGHFEKINSKNVTITTIDGGTGQLIAETDFPEAKQLSMPDLMDFTEELMNVSTGKADLTFAEPVLINRYCRTNPHSIENADPTKPIRLFPDCLAFRRGEFEFKAMLNTVLAEVINSGQMDKIIKKYEPDPLAVFRVALPYRHCN